MKTRFLKTFCIFLFIILAVNITNTNASYSGKVISGGKSFINSRNDSISINEQALQQTSSDLYNILLTIAFVIDAVAGVILGIRWMFSGVDEKADVKKELIIFFIATCVAFGAFAVWKVIVDFLQSVF